MGNPTAVLSALPTGGVAVHMPEYNATLVSVPKHTDNVWSTSVEMYNIPFASNKASNAKMPQAVSAIKNAFSYVSKFGRSDSPVEVREAGYPQSVLLKQGSSKLHFMDFTQFETHEVSFDGIGLESAHRLTGNAGGLTYWLIAGKPLDAFKRRDAESTFYLLGIPQVISDAEPNIVLKQLNLEPSQDSAFSRLLGSCISPSVQSGRWVAGTASQAACSEKEKVVGVWGGSEGAHFASLSISSFDQNAVGTISMCPRYPHRRCGIYV